MAKYSKISRSLLDNKQFKSLSDDAKLLYISILIHPSITSIGAMRYPLYALSADLNWKNERLLKAFREASRKGWLVYDEEALILWAPYALDDNAPESPNVVKYWIKALDDLPDCHTKVLLSNKIKRYLLTRSEAFYKDLPKNFNVQIQENESLSLSLNESLSEGLPESITIAITNSNNNNNKKTTIVKLFEFWKKTCRHPKAKMDKVRKRKIEMALDNFDEDILHKAILGCSKSRWHQGDNPSGKIYDSLDLIFRNAEKIESFAALANGDICHDGFLAELEMENENAQN